MTNSKIAFEYIRQSSTLSSIAEEFGLSKSAVVSAIQSFLKSRSGTSYSRVIQHKFNVELIKNFLLSGYTAKEFATEHGMSETAFVILASKVIDDPEIVPSDALANKIYRKLLVKRKSLGIHTPKRIVKILANFYVSNERATQQAIASSYNISRNSIATIFKRGIEDGTIDKVLAEQIISKSCYLQSRRKISAYHSRNY